MTRMQAKVNGTSLLITSLDAYDANHNVMLLSLVGDVNRMGQLSKSEKRENRFLLSSSISSFKT